MKNTNIAKLYGVFFTEDKFPRYFPHSVFHSKEAAKRKAASLRAELTRGQKKEFKYSYITREIE